MRVLHVIGALSKGGAEKQCKLLTDQLCQMGHEVSIVYFHDKFKIEKNPAIDYYKITRGGKLNILSLFKQLRRVVKNVKPDIIHNWLPEILTIPCAIIARQLNIPNISSQRRILQRNADFFDTLRDYFILINHLISDKVVCNFEPSLENGMLRKILESKNAICIQNGFELLPPSSVKVFDFLKEDTIKLIFVGRLVAQKNIDTLIRAVATLKKEGAKIQLVIFGEGKLRKDLEILVQSLDLLEEDVNFAGYIADWHSYIHSFDLFVFPTNAEGMPNVLIEAMNLKIPVISSNIPEISSIFTHGKECHLIENMDQLKLSRAIKFLMGDQSYRVSLVERAYNTTRRFSIQSMSSRFYECYKSLVD